jgi:hypothetical protein
MPWARFHAASRPPASQCTFGALMEEEAAVASADNEKLLMVLSWLMALDARDGAKPQRVGRRRDAARASRGKGWKATTFSTPTTLPTTHCTSMWYFGAISEWAGSFSLILSTPFRVSTTPSYARRIALVRLGFLLFRSALLLWGCLHMDLYMTRWLHMHGRVYFHGVHV